MGITAPTPEPAWAAMSAPVDLHETIMRTAHLVEQLRGQPGVKSAEVSAATTHLRAAAAAVARACPR